MLWGARSLGLFYVRRRRGIYRASSREPVTPLRLFPVIRHAGEVGGCSGRLGKRDTSSIDQHRGRRPVQAAAASGKTMSNDEVERSQDEDLFSKLRATLVDDERPPASEYLRPARCPFVTDRCSQRE